MSEAVEATLTLPEEDVYAEFCTREWCDGLPFVPPTAERVRAMLAGARTKAAESLGAMAPLWRRVLGREAGGQLGDGRLRARVLPGDRGRGPGPARSRLQPLRRPGHHASGGAPGVVTGPYARTIGLHPGSGLFGPGFRANATIGRAIRLILMNVGGALAGARRHVDAGEPGQVLLRDHRARGLAVGAAARRARVARRTQSVVTVFGGEGPHNVNDHVSTTARRHPQQRGGRGHLAGLQRGLVSLAEPDPGGARARARRDIAADGFTRADVQRFVFENARMPLGRMKLGGMWGMHDWPHVDGQGDRRVGAAAARALGR